MTILDLANMIREGRPFADEKLRADAITALADYATLYTEMRLTIEWLEERAKAVGAIPAAMHPGSVLSVEVAKIKGRAALLRTILSNLH